MDSPLDLLHLSYVDRWVIAPTLRYQSVAEHTFRVVAIGLQLSRLRYIDDRGTFGSGITDEDIYRVAMFHDGDERITGDIPGPEKSKIPGYLRDVNTMSSTDCLVKVADSIETGTFWVQWGNHAAWTGHPSNNAPRRDIEKITHYSAKIPGLLEAAEQVWLHITGKEMMTCLTSSQL